MMHTVWGRPVTNVKMCWGKPCLDQTSDAASPEQSQMQYETVAPVPTSTESALTKEDIKKENKQQAAKLALIKTLTKPFQKASKKNYDLFLKAKEPFWEQYKNTKVWDSKKWSSVVNQAIAVEGKLRQNLLDAVEKKFPAENTPARFRIHPNAAHTRALELGFFDKDGHSTYPDFSP